MHRPRVVEAMVHLRSAALFPSNSRTLTQSIARTTFASPQAALSFSTLLTRADVPAPARPSPSPYLLLPTQTRQHIRMFALTPYRRNQPKTFSVQHTLPRLPVPDLDASLERYIKSLRPILRQMADRGELEEGSSVEKELEKRREWATDFARKGGKGRVLQERLVDVDRSTPSSWLDDGFWLKKAYHEWRAPLLVNSNWWLLFRDDPSIPESVRTGMGGLGKGEEFGDWQFRRAAWVTSRLIDFKQKLDRQEIIPDSSRAGAFCMHQYTRVFGLTRLPQHGSDTFYHTSHPTNPRTQRHVTVIVKDQFYELEVIDQDGRPSSPTDLEAALRGIVEDVKKKDAEGSLELPVGVLSSDGRDEWTAAREHLLSVSPTNRTTLDSIESSLFSVSLDSFVLPVPNDHPGPPHPATPPYVDAQSLACSGAGRVGHNRWFDKCLSVVVEANGRGGIMGEHSPCDALIPSIVVDYALAETIPDELAASSAAPSNQSWRRLSWAVDAKVAEDVRAAEERAKAVAADSDPRMLWFDEYGAEWIKKVGKHSPDAYLQMVLQLAYYKQHGRMTPTYETASTRLFLHGRTDVIRTLSDESYDFCKGLEEAKKAGTLEKQAPELQNLLQRATTAHNAYTKDASLGKGCDRHMMGLRLVQSATDPPSHPLFDDGLFTESQTWRLSTSGLSAGDRFNGTGFGAVYPDGYGINYLAGSKLLKFGVESKRSNPQTGTTAFIEKLVEALREMRSVVEAAAAAEAGAAKAKL